MKVIVGCEESQRVTIEFRKLGIEAYSCDILEPSGDNPQWHIQDDIFNVIDRGWDMGIFFPPCTDLSLSGARWFEKKRKNGSQKKSIEFFMKLWHCNIPKICIENPMNIIGGEYVRKHYPDLCVKYDLPLKKTQTIQPYQFGDAYQKTTWLWLKNLPKLKPTNIVDKGKFKTWVDKNGKTKRMASWYDEGRGRKDRSRYRSKTFPGIAKAMANQWS